MKRPLVGPFFGRFYFYMQSLQTMSHGCWMSNIRVFGLPVHEKIFSNSLIFCPLLGPNRCQPLAFCNRESPFPKDAFCKIWFKSVQWFWRSHLKEMFTDGRWTRHDHYSSLEPLAQMRYNRHKNLGPCACCFSFGRLVQRHEI